MRVIIEWEVNSKSPSDTENFVAFLREFDEAVERAKPGKSLCDPTYTEQCSLEPR